VPGRGYAVRTELVEKLTVRTESMRVSVPVAAR